MKRFSLLAAILIMSWRFPPWLHLIQVPRTCQRFRALWRMRAMFTLPPMTEINSIQICFPKIGTRSAPYRTPFRSGAN